MINFLKKHYRGLALSFLIGTLISPLFGQGLKADITNANFFEGIDSVDEVVVQYHLLVNEAVNKYLEKLTDEDYQDYEATAYVSADECSDANVSTYCLAVLLNEYLLDFELKLRSMETDLDLYDEEDTAITDLDSAFVKVLNDNAKIDREIKVARSSLDLTLAVYNQVASVYPLHKEMADLILNMENYRNNLAEIRRQMELYPSRFNNATSPYCT